MKKLLPLLFGGLTLVSISFGLFKSQSVKKANAWSLALTFDDDNELEFGTYPQSIDSGLTLHVNYDTNFEDFLHNEGASDVTEGDGFTSFTYQEERYAARICYAVPENQEEEFSKDQLKVLNFLGNVVIYKYEPIRWIAYKEQKKGYDLIAKSVLLVNRYHSADDETTYINTELYQKLNNDFVNLAFDETAKKSLISYKIDGKDSYIDLDTKNSLRSELAYLGATDYAIGSNINSSHSYAKAPYWFKQKWDNGNTNNHVCWTNDELTEVPPTDDTIGVRPIIRADVSTTIYDSEGGGGGGGGGSTFHINFSGNVPMLIIGFILMGGGLFMVFFFMNKWAKNLKLNPAYRCKVGNYIVIGIFLTITIIGCNLYAYGTMIKLSGFGAIGNEKEPIWGLYLSSSLMDDEEFSLNHGMYALTTDGKVYYYFGDIYDSYTGRRMNREDGEGTYVVKGDTITITFPETWRTYSFEHSPMTYKYQRGYAWGIVLYLDYDVQFAYSTAPLVPGSGLYQKNTATSIVDHKPDGRAYYTAKELGLA